MVTAKPVNAAWVVVLTSTNDYIKGILSLKHALHTVHKSQYPLLVLYTQSVVPEIRTLLKKVGCKLKEIEPIYPKRKVTYKMKRFSETWTKLVVWDQINYSRLVLLDADMLPLHNMDELMTLPLPDKEWVAACHACVCNPQKITHYPSHWVPENCAYTACDKGANTVAPPVTEKIDYFNSGLVVLTPDSKKFHDMLAYLESIQDLNIYPFPDQDFLNEIFKGRWKSLSYIYNALKTLQSAHSPMWETGCVKNVHYILSKPWDVHLDQELSVTESIYRELYEYWWDSYKAMDQEIDLEHVANIIISS
ncbi:glycosyltransferase family 8 protein [Backusella circina FSU 941]|nr:glycosyltransferase family 8 protein [Backusella circina FSU 941]